MSNNEINVHCFKSENIFFSLINPFLSVFKSCLVMTAVTVMTLMYMRNMHIRKINE